MDLLERFLNFLRWRVTEKTQNRFQVIEYLALIPLGSHRSTTITHVVIRRPHDVYWRWWYVSSVGWFFFHSLYTILSFVLNTFKSTGGPIRFVLLRIFERRGTQNTIFLLTLSCRCCLRNSWRLRGYSCRRFGMLIRLDKCKLSEGWRRRTLRGP